MKKKDSVGYKKKQRNSGDRKRKSIILLAVEDWNSNKTERLYFSSFAKDRRRRLEFARGNETEPTQMIRNLIKKQDEIGFDPELGDTAYCLIDADFDPSKDIQIRNADQEAGKKHISVLLSAPSFEIWFLCHFHAKAHQYLSKEKFLEAIKKEIPGYQKNRTDIYDLLKDRTSKAVENAKRLEKTCIDRGCKPHTTSFTPSTEIYLLAEELLKDGMNY